MHVTDQAICITREKCRYILVLIFIYKKKRGHMPGKVWDEANYRLNVIHVSKKGLPMDRSTSYPAVMVL